MSIDMIRWIEFFTRELATARGRKAARRARHATGCARATPHSDRAEGHGSRRHPGPGSADDRLRSTPLSRNSASPSVAGSPRVRRACRAAASGTREPRGITCRHAARPERGSALAPNYRHQRVRLTPRRAGGRWNRATGPRTDRNPPPWWRFDLEVGLVQSIQFTPPQLGPWVSRKPSLWGYALGRRLRRPGLPDRRTDIVPTALA